MLLVIIIVKCLLPCNASGEHIYLCMHTQLSGTYLLLFSTCVSVNFCPLRELDTIGTGRMDLIITYSGLPPNLTRCTSSQILLLATFHCQVLHKCILPCIFANSRKQRSGNTQGIWQEQCTIYCTPMLLKVLVLAALDSIC